MGFHPGGTIVGMPIFLALMIVFFFFSDGSFPVVGPYSGEVWPTMLRATGMGSAYGIGGIGKVIGPWGLALIVGSDNPVTPQASLDRLLPCFIFLAAWFVLAAIFYLFVGPETKGKDLAEMAEKPRAVAAADARAV